MRNSIPIITAIVLLPAIFAVRSALADQELFGAGLPQSIPGVQYLLHSPPLTSDLVVPNENLFVGAGILPFGSALSFNLSESTAKGRLAASDLNNVTLPFKISLQSLQLEEGADENGMDMDIRLRFHNITGDFSGFIPYDAAFTVAAGQPVADCTGVKLAPQHRPAAEAHLEYRFRLDTAPTFVTTFNATPGGNPRSQLSLTPGPGNTSAHLSVRVQWLSPAMAPHVSCQLAAITPSGSWLQIAAPCVGVVHGQPLPADEGTHTNSSWAPGLVWQSNHDVRVRVHLRADGLGHIPLLRDALLLNCSVSLPVAAMRNGSLDTSGEWRAATTGGGGTAHLPLAPVLLGVVSVGLNVDDGLLCSWRASQGGSAAWCAESGGASRTLGPQPAGTLAATIDVQCYRPGFFGVCCVLFAGGTVRCASNDESARLGAQPPASGLSEPLDLGQPAMKLTVGERHTCVLLLDSSVRCWGLESVAVGLGMDSDTYGVEEVNPASHVTIPSQPGASHASAGREFSCALFNGTCIKCWGVDADGKLGYTGALAGLTLGADAATTPVKLPCIDLPASHDYVQVESGGDVTCALTADGEVYCWGSLRPVASPPDLRPMELGTPAFALVHSAASNAVCALLVSGTAWCFGQPSAIAGLVELADEVAPLDSIELSGVVGRLGAVDSASCSFDLGSACIVNLAGVQCWGRDISPQFLPAGVSDTRTVLPLDALAGFLPHAYPKQMHAIQASAHALQPGRAAHIALASSAGCQLDRVSGIVWCWGSQVLSVGGALIDTGVTRDKAAGSSAARVRLPSPAVHVFGGLFDIFIATEDGRLFSLVLRNSGFLLPGTFNAPGQLRLPGLHIRSVASERSHACACFRDGHVFCWGEGSNGKLGYGNTDDVEAAGPLQFANYPVVSLSGAAVQVAVSEEHSCAVLASGHTQCWGLGEAMRLGFGDLDQDNVGNIVSRIPSDVGVAVALPLAFKVAVGTAWTAVLGTDGGVTTTVNGGENLATASIADIVGKTNSICAISLLGEVRCARASQLGMLVSGAKLPFVGAVVQLDIQPTIEATPPVACAVLLSGSTQCLSLFGAAAPSRTLLGFPTPASGVVVPPQLALQRTAVMPSRYMILPQLDDSILSTVSVLSSPAQLRGGGVAGIPLDSSQQLRLLPLWLRELERSTHVERDVSPADLRIPCLEAGASIGAPFLPSSLHTLYSEQQVDVVVGSVSQVPACAWPRGTFSDTGGVFISSVQLAGSPAGSAVQLSPLGGQTLALGGSFWPLLLLHRGPVNITVGGMPCEGALSLRASVHELNCRTTALAAGTVLPAAGTGIRVSLHHTYPQDTSPVHAPLNVTFTAPSIQSVVSSSSAATGVQGGGVLVRGSSLGKTAGMSGAPATLALTQIMLHDAAMGGNIIGQCVVMQASFEAAACTMPPYTGRVYVSAVLAQGLSSTTRTTFVYAKPTITQVFPAVLFHNADSMSNVTIQVQGTNLGHAAGAVAGLSVAGTPCPYIVWMSPQLVECRNFPVRSLPADSVRLPSGVELAFAADEAPVTAAVEVVGQPVVNAVQIILGASTSQGTSFMQQTGGILRISGSAFAAVAASGGAVNVSVAGRPCAVAGTSPTEITCALGSGVGGLNNAVVVRSDGARGELVLVPLQYEVPQVTLFSPTLLLPIALSAPAGAPVSVDINITGAFFGIASRPVSVAIAKGAVTYPCASAEWISASALRCRGMPTAAFAPAERFGGSALRVSVGGVAASILSSASLEMLPLPEISSVQPAAVGATGGVQVQLYGAGLGTRLSDVVNVTVGAALCTSLLWVSPERLWCTAPSLAAAGSAAAPIRVATAGGYSSSSVQASLAYRAPQIFSVDPDQRLLAVATDPLSLATLTVTGAELGSPGQELGASMRIGSVDCVAAQGRIVLPSADGSSMRCEGFQQASLPAPAGLSSAVAVTVTTPSGITVSQLGGAIVLKAPAISRVDPPSANAGSPVVILGEAFGWASSDVRGVSVGSQLLPNTSWQWSQSSITITALPPPLAGQARELSVSVALRTGHTAILPGAFSYLAAPQAPVDTPLLPCSFRDRLNAAQVVFVWTASPVPAWAVRSSGPSPPWTASAEAASSITLADAAPALDFQAFNSSLRLQTACPHTWQYLQRHPSAAWHQLPVLTASDAAVQWLQVAATESRTDRALDGPLSAYAGPLMPACSAAAGGEQYLATQFAAAGRWGAVACAACPVGAVCGGRPYEALVNAAGMFRANWDKSGLTFVECPRAESCLRPQVRIADSGSLGYLQSDDPTIAVHLSVLQPDDVLLQSASGAVSVGGTANSAVSAICPDGYSGRFCAQCEAGFTRTGDRECTTCAGLAVVWLALLGGVLLGLAGMVFLTITTLRSRGEPKKAHVALSKLLFSHMQTIGIAAAFPFEWPDPLRGLFAVLDAGSSVGTALVSVDCLGFDSSAFRASAATQLLLPLILLGIVSALWVLYSVLFPTAGADSAARAGEERAPPPQLPVSVQQNPLRRHAGNIAGKAVISNGAKKRAGTPTWACSFCTLDVKPWTGWIVSVLVVSFVLHLSLVKTALSVMTCDEIAGKRFLVGDYDVDCDSADNTGWIYGVGMAGLLVYGAGIPLGSFIVVWRRRTRLDETSIRRKFGFLYVTYTPGAWYWEMAILMRKVGLAVIAVLLQPLGAGLQSTCAIVLLGSSLLVHERVSPFQDSLLNKLESSSLYVALVTIAGGAALLDSEVGLASKQFVTVMLLLCNAVFVFVVVFFLVRGAALQGGHGPALTRLLQRSGLGQRSVRALLGADTAGERQDKPHAGSV